MKTTHFVALACTIVFAACGDMATQPRSTSTTSRRVVNPTSVVTFSPSSLAMVSGDSTHRGDQVTVTATVYDASGHNITKQVADTNWLWIEPLREDGTSIAAASPATRYPGGVIFWGSKTLISAVVPGSGNLVLKVFVNGDTISGILPVTVTAP